MALKRSVVPILVGAAVVAVAACSTVASLAPVNAALDSQLNSAAASSAAGAAVADYADLLTGDSVGGSFARARKPGQVSALGAGSSCTQSGGAGDLRYYCPADTITYSGGGQTDTIIRNRNYEFFAAGTAQSTFTASVDSINFGGASGMPIYLAVHAAQANAVSHRLRNYSVTDKTPNFASDTMRTWNGTTTAADTGNYVGSVYTLGVTGTETDVLVNVVFVHPASTHPYPLSGQYQRTANVNYTYTGPVNGNGAASRMIVITFDGTQTPVIQVTGGTSALTCNINLTNGALSNCH